jgi:hypothetical protein
LVNNSGICCTISTGRRAAGRNADGQRHRNRRNWLGLGQWRQGKNQRRARRAREGCLWRQREPEGEGLDLGDQFPRKRALGRLAAGLPGRLGHIVGGASTQGLDGHFGAALGQRTAHDNRHFVAPRAQLSEGDQSIHHGHFYIQ